MLNFVTTNPGKVREATEYLDDEVVQFDFDYPEVQADDLGTVAAQGAREAYHAADGPVIVDDAGLFIDAFDGFPGPYSSYVEDTLGVERLAEVCADLDDARARFECVLAYCDGDAFDASPDPIDESDRAAAAATVAGGESDDDGLPVKLFYGQVPGRIVPPRGDDGFGFDPIFEHDGTTFAEVTPAEKNAVSHRGRALAKFAEWYASR